MARQPCIECKTRQPAGNKRRCLVCALRHSPIGDQVAASRRRLAMVPEELRVKRVPERLWPAGARWCASCQSFVDLADVPKGSSRCRPCASAAQHGAMIEKTYGITAAQYDELLAFQGGRCAICRAKPRNRRLATDHDHRTGYVRGLVCAGSQQSGCNFALGLFHDDVEIVRNALIYMETPPAALLGIEARAPK